MFDILAAGVILGLSAGLAPGPLLTLVIAETLQHDIKAGIKVAVAPLVTDLPLILLTVFVLTKLSQMDPILGVISMLGGLFLLLMGYENLRSTGVVCDRPAAPGQASLTKGALANVLSPYPYLFWLGVGAPLMTKAMRVGPAAPVLFLVTFYALLVGSKVVLAILVGRSKAIVRGRLLIYVFRVIGALLCVLAFGLIRDGLALLGVLPGQAVGA